MPFSRLQFYFCHPTIRGDDYCIVPDRRDIQNFTTIFPPIVDINIMPDFKNRDIQRWIISTDQW